MDFTGIQALTNRERNSMSAAAADLLNRIELKPKQVLFRSGRKRDKKLYNGWIVAGNPKIDRYIAYSESPWVDSPEWFTVTGPVQPVMSLKDCPSNSTLKSLIEDILTLNALPDFQQFLADICGAPRPSRAGSRSS